jgi:hypothetical protein
MAYVIKEADRPQVVPAASLDLAKKA